MTDIHRSSILQGAADQLNIQQGVDSFPKQLGNIITPTFEINPKYSLIVKAQTKTASAASTIYTTPADKDFYLTSIALGMSKDVTSDNVNFIVTAVIGGAVRTLISLPSNTVTLYQDCSSISYSFPLKIDRNTAIQIAGSFTAGALNQQATITGFVLE